MVALFRSLAEVLEKVEATKKRLYIISLAANFLKSLAAEEVECAVLLMLGRVFPNHTEKTIDINWVTLSRILKRITDVNWNIFYEAFSGTGDLGAALKIVYEKTKVKKQVLLLERKLTIIDVTNVLKLIAETSGSGSKERKERLTAMLFSQASPAEAKFLVKIFVGAMRTGFQEGLMERAVAEAFGVSLLAVQKASMALGDIGKVAAIAKTKGEKGLLQVDFQVFRPIRLMLAQTSEDINDALLKHGGRTSFEFKYDGARVQIHKKGEEVRVFSRRLTDVTQSLPEVVETVKANIEAKNVILEGEVIAIGDSDFPIPFQHLMRRFKRIHQVQHMAEKIPVKLYLFDVVYLNGKNLISLPYIQRRDILAEKAGGIALAKQIITDKKSRAEKFLREAIESGHEGLMAKRLDSHYTPGTRGKHWLKIKHVLEPLDLVITSAEYGYGRRHNWLSDYCLAARDTADGKFLNIGKTFKGLTDQEIIEITRLLKGLIIKVEHNRVVVLPKIVVEVVYNEIQKSSKNKSGMALRFARISRVRCDKNPEEADTLEKVRKIYERQLARKGRYKTD